MSETANPQRREALAQQFAAIDSEIDKRVYALYGLSAADTHFVEQTLADLSPEGEKRPKSWRPAAKQPVGTIRKTQGDGRGVAKLVATKS